ncbi:MAG: DUF1538 domain-containing protein [Bacilli bacterium]
MGKEIASKLKEGLISILPIVIILIILNFAIPALAFDDAVLFPNHVGPTFVSFLISVVPLVLGMSLFNMGADKSTGRIGSIVGSLATKRRTIYLLLIIAVLMGFLTTLAEPDLNVLAGRLYPNSADFLKRIALMVIAALGVGLFLLVAILRILYDKSIKYWLIIGYALVLALGYFSDADFFSVIFDSGGVTTGPVTVPFILSLGISVASVLGGSKAEDDSFGYSGLCSLGTVLSITVFSMVLKNTNGVESIQASFASSSLFETVSSFEEMPTLFLHAFSDSFISVLISMIPITLFFLVYNFFLKLNRRDFFSIIIGLLYVFAGLVLFLFGAEAGLIPVSSTLGKNFASLPPYALILLGFLFGFISMLAEPGVHILAEQVNEVSRGVINKPMIFLALSLSTGLAIIINTLRVYLNIDMILIVSPLLIVAFGLAFLTPDIYVSIAIDSAGVATGTMASCFFLPLFIGYSSVIYADDLNFGQEIMRNGFGVVGLISLMPIICVEILGIISVVKVRLAYKKAFKAVSETDDSQVIHLPV